MIADRASLARQGTVVADWHVVRGRRQGPYYRVAYTRRGVNRAIYVGRSEDLARLARGLLAEFQAQRRSVRQHRRLRAYLRRQLRELKARHQREMAAFGVVLDGWEPRSYPELFEKLREGGRRAPGAGR